MRVFLRGGDDKVRRRGVSVCGCLSYCAGQSRVDGEGATAHRRERRRRLQCVSHDMVSGGDGSVCACLC